MSREKESNRARLGTAALAAGAALAAAHNASAADFVVTSNADSGPGTLRQAILDANALAGADQIFFDASTTGSLITLTSGEIPISDSLLISGPGAPYLTISGNDNSRIFYIYQAQATPIDVTISGVTLADGLNVVSGDAAASAGGAIRSVGENLELAEVVLSNNVAGGSGGAVAFFGDAVVDVELEVRNSTISGNTAAVIGQGGDGGGIYAFGTYEEIVLTNVRFEGNSAGYSGGGFGVAGYSMDVEIAASEFIDNSAGTLGAGYGGGIGIGSLYHEVDIDQTTISSNDASSSGGGLAASLADLTITRSTISGNTAGCCGGGLDLGLGYSEIENSTIAYNEAVTNGGGIYAFGEYLTIKETTISNNIAGENGGGIAAIGTSLVTIHNSIVANNTAPAGQGMDLYDDGDSLFEVTYSLIENPESAQIEDGTGAILNDDPELGPLQDNGGPTATMAPAATSPVIDAGDATGAPLVDQRGFPRPVGASVDMGSVEVQPIDTVQFVVAVQTVDENTSSVSVLVTRTGLGFGAAQVQVALGPGSTATGGGVDFTFGGATLTWADGDTEPKGFSFTVHDDPFDEPDETAVLQLTLPVNVTIGTQNLHTVTIQDNDAPPADVAIVKSIAPGTYVTGTNATFNIGVTNNGPGSATGVTVTDVLPAQVMLVSATPTQGSCNNVPPLVCNLGTLADDATATVQIVVTIDDPGLIENSASVDAVELDENGTNDSSTASFTAIPPPEADLVIDKSIAPGTYLQGTNATFNITVTNNGPAPATAVEVLDTLPAGVSFVSATPSQGSCNNVSPVDCDLGTLADDASATIALVVQVNAASSTVINNTAAATTTAPESILGNNSDTASFTVGAPPEADLVVDKSVAPGTYLQGTNATYNITVTNNGPAPATAVEVLDTLPAGVSLVSATPSQGTCNNASPVDCDLGTLADDASATIALVVQITAASGTAIDNTASASTTAPESILGNNSDRASFTVGAPPAADLSIAKNVSPGTFVQGGTAQYNLTVTNNGPAPATNVTVTDTLPADVTLISATPSQGSCSGTTTVTCTLGTLADDASATITLVVRITGTGTISNTASADATEDDTVAGNNQATAAFSAALASNVPALDPRMQLLLAALIAAMALGILGKRA